MTNRNTDKDAKVMKIKRFHEFHDGVRPLQSVYSR